MKKKRVIIGTVAIILIVFIIFIISLAKSMKRVKSYTILNTYESLTFTEKIAYKLHGYEKAKTKQELIDSGLIRDDDGQLWRDGKVVSSEDTSKSYSAESYTSSSKSSLVNMKLGKSYPVNDNGIDKYRITIEGIRFTDQRNQYSDLEAEKVFFLDFNYENVSSSDEVDIFSSNFKVLDENGYILKSYPVFDENRRCQRVPIGGRCSASEAYAMPTSSKTIKVLYYDNMLMDPLGEITIETGL